MESISNKKLGLIFTRKISLSFWDKIGIFEREIKPYVHLAEDFEEIYFFTYGTSKQDAVYQAYLPKNIKMIFRPVAIPASLYVFLMPLVHTKTFRKLDILKSNQMDGSWAGVFAKKLFSKKLVIRSGYEWLHYLINTKALAWKKFVARGVESLSYKNADKIVITSAADKDFIAETFKIVPEKIEVIGNYIDTDKFRPEEAAGKEKGRVVFVGRLHEDKNLFMLLSALEGLDCRLVLIGDGPQKKALMEEARKLGLRAEFAGKVAQSNLPNELVKSEIFVLSSKSEGNPKALLEAMSCGLACVGANVKGIREIIKDGQNGLLAEPSAESLREKIKLLLENEELRDRLGQAARQKIVTENSFEVAMMKEEKIYEKLL